MDNLTHTLTAVALAQAGLNRKTRFATLALVIGTNLPDVDLVARLNGSATYLRFHRGITHSILGVTIEAALLAALIHYFARSAPPAKKSTPPFHPAWLLAACGIGTASHLLLDLTNSYGIRPFLPFSGRWYALDIMFILDPLLWGLFAAGFGFPALLRLVSEEVGAKKPNYRSGAVFSLCAMLALFGLRWFAHQRVGAQLDSHVYGDEYPAREGAFPSLSNPFEWTGVVETTSAFYVLTANALNPDIQPERARVYHKPAPSAALDAASRTRTATIFLGFARFPWPQVEESEDGFDVTIQDLRFFSRPPTRSGFIVEIRLDKNLRVRSESFSFTGERSRNGP